MGKFCPYSDSPFTAPCAVKCLKKYSYLKDFLNDSPQRNVKSYSIPIKIECMNLADKSICNHACIGCMFCLFGCKGDFCMDIGQTQIQELKDSFFPKVFKGEEFIRLPQVPLSQFRIKYRSFNEFTSVDETENIAVWGANVLEYLSRSHEPRVALEVGVNIKYRSRAGRLDITLMNPEESYLFVAETKTKFEDMMAEMRFEAQMMSYETVLEEECSPDLKRCKFLLIGGNESDLLPYGNNKCTSGPKAKLFYEILKKRNIFFISANALLALGLMKMFVSHEKYNLENLYDYIADDNFIGLLSSGLVTRNDELVPLE